MTFYQSAEFENWFGRYRVTRGYPTLALLEGDKIEPSGDDEWSDYETWEADSSEWPNITIYTNDCCWCDKTANWLLYYREDHNGDDACGDHMREFQETYNYVRSWSPDN